MKLGSPAADVAYDRWNDKMADEYWGANESEPCEICGGDEAMLRQITLDAERYQAIRELSAKFNERFESAKMNSIDPAEIDISDLPTIAGVILVLSAEELDEEIDNLMAIK